MEFICDEERTGDEGNFGIDEQLEQEEKRDEEEHRADNATCMPSLSFLSYETDPANENTDLLRLEWLTKYACEDQRDKDLEDSKSWGFFTWFILM